ncbi:helix-turn-helix transcriptional regulator [Leuconostocaceae bacterium ESL0723]|nr:helix-turn-helix transcriptional regulator [Leuconostocaceae bacterium ESL0723]
MITDIFSERLKIVRKAKNLTQLQLAQKLNLSKRTVSAYEQGLSYPSLETFVKLCEMMETSADYLLGMSDNLHFKADGLTDSQVEALLQFTTLIQNANIVLEREQNDN